MSIGRSGLYIYISNMLNMVFGYVFWLLVANFTGAEGPASVGVVSATISFSTMMSSVLLLGTPFGIQRFIGKEYAQNDFASISSLLASSMSLVLVLSILASVIILAFGQQAILLTKLPWEFLIASTILLIALVIYQLLFSSLIAVSQSKFLLFGAIAQNASKILIVILLLHAGYGLISIVISYVASTLISLPIMSLAILRNIPIPHKITFISDIRRLIKASSVNWVPTIISTIGAQLSVLVVLGYSGAAQAGEYYIASIVFSAAIAVPMAIINAAFPVMSAMTEQSKVLTSRIIKIGLIFSVPLSVILAIYSNDILKLLNPHFENASLPLILFMIAVAPTVLNYGIYFMLYALGKYRSVLIIGLSENVSKIILYFILVPNFGAIGAVISFVSGPLIALAVISITQKKHYSIAWKKVLLVVAIPLIVGLCIYLSKFGPFVGIPLVISSAFYLYIRFTMITVSELREIIYSLLPEFLARKIYPRVEQVVRVIGQKDIFSDL